MAKVTKTNPHVKTAEQRVALVKKDVIESSAGEGIHLTQEDLEPKNLIPKGSRTSKRAAA